MDPGQDGESTSIDMFDSIPAQSIVRIRVHPQVAERPREMIDYMRTDVEKNARATGGARPEGRRRSDLPLELVTFAILEGGEPAESSS